MADTLPTFRIHFHDGTSMDIEAGNSLIAEARARKERPGDFVKKIKLLRAKPELAAALTTKGTAQ